LGKGNKNTAAERKNAIWSFFASVRLTVVLLIVIAVTSIMGTLIPQQEEAQRIMRDLPPALVSTLQSLQLFDMYHSVWFLLLMLLLAVNLIVCSLNRFPRTWRLFQSARSGEPSRRLEGDAADRVFMAGGMPTGVADGLEGLMRRKFKKVRRMEEGDVITLYGEKGAFS